MDPNREASRLVEKGSGERVREERRREE